jgi:hypothetical protein
MQSVQYEQYWEKCRAIERVVLLKAGGCLTGWKLKRSDERILKRRGYRRAGGRKRLPHRPATGQSNRASALTA